MAESDILELLEKVYPRSLTAKEIIDNLDLSSPSIFRNLKSLQKRDEVEYKLVCIPNSKINWRATYRINEKFIKRNIHI